MNKQQELFYKTSDLNICVILQYFDHQIININKSNRNRCIFQLKKRIDTEKILNDLYEGKLLVEPRQFIAIQKETKGRIYN